MSDELLTRWHRWLTGPAPPQHARLSLQLGYSGSGALIDIRADEAIAVLELLIARRAETGRVENARDD